MVKSGLDGHGHPFDKIAIESQVSQAKLRRAFASRRVASKIAEVFHVVHIEANDVANAVREEHRMHASLD